MKDLRPAIRSLLLSNPQVNAYVGGTRVYTVVLPQGITAPSLVQNLISEQSDYHNTGASGLGGARIQLDAWALTVDEAVTLGGLAHDVLSGFSGIVLFGSASPKDSIVIRGIFKDMARDDYDPAARLYSRRRDFFVWYGEF